MNSRRPGFANRQHHRLMVLLLALVFSGVTPSTLAAPKSTTHTIDIEALKFSLPTLEVKPGDTVIWKNKDAFPHNVIAENKGFRSPGIQSGQSWEFKARNLGVFQYVCTLHPGMKAVLTVK